MVGVTILCNYAILCPVDKELNEGVENVVEHVVSGKGVMKKSAR